MHPLNSHQRQVHLDFHTSPHIPGVAREFDAESFADTFARAHVNSVTLFAKCHHGYTYYPSKVCASHPELLPKGRDLLGEQMEALHRRGIRCPLYITVGWDELLTQTHPEWRTLQKDGNFGGTDSHLPGWWRSVNWLHPAVQQHIEDITRETLARYGRDVDGYFFDICIFPKGTCWSPESIAFREKHGVMDDSPEGFERFQTKAQASFSKRFRDLIQASRPEATLFFNAGSDTCIEPDLGIRGRYDNMTHMEIESLPTGAWGYYHFPRLARSIGHWGKPWLGMTGRFQTMWGDFGGLKPQPALEYECFRAQALGGGNSIGDQLPPGGVPDAGAYRLIGEVYQQVAFAEPFYEDSDPCCRIGILTSGSVRLDPGETAKSDEGAIQMCEESHYDCRLLDGGDRLDELDLVILGDTTTLSPPVVTRLKTYYENGGSLLVSAGGGCDREGNWLLDFLPVRARGGCDYAPAYWRVRDRFSPALAMSDRVVYQRGWVLETGPDVEVLVDRVFPYFNRDAVRFCSHGQTPPRPEVSGQPAVVAGERFVVFADPIFREYRESGNIAVRDAWRRVMRRLVGEAPFGEGLASTVQVYPRRRGSNLLLTLLHYIPVRKALTIDMIEERANFAGEVLRIQSNTGSPRQFEGPDLPPAPDGEGWCLPQDARGRLLIEVPDYFP